MKLTVEAVGGAVSDKVRLRILRRLIKVESMTVTAIGDFVDMSQPAVSHHLTRLRHAEMVDSKRAGKFSHYFPTKFGRSVVAAMDKLVAEVK